MSLRSTEIVAIQKPCPQNQQTPVLCRNDSHKKPAVSIKVPEKASFSEVVGALENTQVAEEGLEPPTRG